MDVAKFTDEARVRGYLSDLRNDSKTENKKYSDVTDDQGHQYVDLVMEGGGVLGVALVGYTYVLEEMGIRFKRIGGTSAGSINALLLAALGKPHEAKSARILKHLAAIKISDFLDGDSDVQRLLETALQEKSEYGLLQRFFPTGMLIWNLLQVKDTLDSNLGLNPGTVFHNWLKQILKIAKVETTEQLLAQMRQLPALTANGKLYDAFAPEIVDGKTIEKSPLAIVAADVTTETKVIFPKMAKLYWSNPDLVNPADYVRASMSIPIFFQPFRVSNIPQGKPAWDEWHERAGYKGNLPNDCLFIDGGIMSNFPINVFHVQNKKPLSPTFGARLGVSRMNPQIVNSPLQLLDAIFDAARHTLDYDFIFNNPDYEKVVTVIDTGAHNWLDFEMDDQEKIELFVCGAKAAYQFLKTFDWKGYQNIRTQMLQMPKDDDADAKPSSRGQN